MLEAHEAFEVMISVRLHRGGTNANRTFELLLTISPVDSMIKTPTDYLTRTLLASATTQR